MKKPFRLDGMAHAEILYNDIEVNVSYSDLTSKCKTITCPGPIVAKRDGWNLRHALNESDKATSQQLVNKLLEKYCRACARELKAQLCREMERGNGK